MAEAILQNGTSNGLSDENQPPSDNHVNSFEEKTAGEGGSGDIVASEKTDGDKEKSDKDKDRHRSSSHHKSSSHKSSHRDKDGHRHSSSSKHKSSSSSKDKDGHRSSSSHHKSSSKDKDRHGHSSSSSSKHHSSSSSSKHPSSSSSSKDKHHSSSGSSSKHHSSSSSKHHSSSSSSKHKSDKHRSDKDKHRSSSSHHRSSSSHHSSSSKKESAPMEVKSEPVIKQELMDVTDAPVKSEPLSPVKPVKMERDAGDSEDEMPLSARKEALKPKAVYTDSEDDEPLSARAEKIKKENHDDLPKKRKQEDDDDFCPVPKKKKIKEEKKVKKPVKQQAVKQQAVKQQTTSPVKKKKKEQGEGDGEKKWKWWEDDTKQDGVKWTFLEHKGCVFAPPYERVQDNVAFFYDGDEMKLSEGAEEVAGFYARMLDHEYTTRQTFNDNFFRDWKKTMTKEERGIITDLGKCNFKEYYDYYKMKSEERKSRSKEEKKVEKEANAALVEEYGYCEMDGHREKIGNFRIEPPGLFRGRGDHPKQGMLKTRTMPEDIIINCSKDSVIPQPPEGHRWKEVRHDNTVTWLSSWNENIQGSTKYIMLGATSKLKGAKDWQKYETARKLHKIVDKIRATYREDFKSKEMRLRQRSVALYFIDKLALRAGNEKDSDESADTVGCCSLRTEHVKLSEELDGQEYVVEFDFLGKDSIRYYNKVPVEKRVFKNLQLFTENKSEGDDLFDRLNTAIMNKHLQSLMDGLTAKVFRTYNASRTLQEQLNLLTQEDDSVAAKTLSYNRANRAVAVLCNHQRAAPKNFSKQMENMKAKIDAKRDAIKGAKKDVKAAKSDLKASKSVQAKTNLERKKKAVERLEEQLMKLEVQSTDKEENKEIALGTSKLNYLDPRISVAWCKKWGVPIEKVYNKTQRDKFAWAIDMTEEDYDFTQMEDE